MSATLSQKQATGTPTSACYAELDDVIRQRLETCAYRYCFNQIRWTFHDGKLVLHGRVPSFYLKQVLQTLMRDIKAVQQIVNHVDVVSATGLSSNS